MAVDILQALLGAAMGVLARFSWAYSYRGSLFLIAGGSFILGVLVIVLLVQSTLFGSPLRRESGRGPTVIIRPPQRPHPLAVERAHRLAEHAATDPRGAFALGARAGRALRALTLDSALDRFVSAGLGDPRIVSTTAHHKLVRVRACRTCTAAETPDARRPHGCEYERGFLQGVLTHLTGGKAEVKEVACRNRGDESCDYEVVY